MNFNKITIQEKRVTSVGVDRKWNIYCGIELIGIITKYETLGFEASCFLKVIIVVILILLRKA